MPRLYWRRTFVLSHRENNKTTYYELIKAGKLPAFVFLSCWVNFLKSNIMSKDKGVKNIKKAPADKTKGKGKVVSAYKSEGKSSYGTDSRHDVSTPKSDSKTGNSKNS